MTKHQIEAYIALKKLEEKAKATPSWFEFELRLEKAIRRLEQERLVSLEKRLHPITI